MVLKHPQFGPPRFRKGWSNNKLLVPHSLCSDPLPEQPSALHESPAPAIEEPIPPSGIHHSTSSLCTSVDAIFIAISNSHLHAIEVIPSTTPISIQPTSISRLLNPAPTVPHRPAPLTLSAVPLSTTTANSSTTSPPLPDLNSSSLTPSSLPFSLRQQLGPSFVRTSSPTLNHLLNDIPWSVPAELVEEPPSLTDAPTPIVMPPLPESLLQDISTNLDPEEAGDVTCHDAKHSIHSTPNFVSLVFYFIYLIANIPVDSPMPLMSKISHWNSRFLRI